MVPGRDSHWWRLILERSVGCGTEQEESLHLKLYTTNPMVQWLQKTSLNIRGTLLLICFLCLWKLVSFAVFYFLSCWQVTGSNYAFFKAMSFETRIGNYAKMTLLFSLLPEISSCWNYKSLKLLLKKNKSGLAHALNIAVLYSSCSHTALGFTE